MGFSTAPFCRPLSLSVGRKVGGNMGHVGEVSA